MMSLLFIENFDKNQISVYICACCKHLTPGLGIHESCNKHPSDITKRNINMLSCVGIVTVTGVGIGNWI
jgi:hypothetical protein